MIVLFGSNFVFFIVIPFGTAHFVCWGSGGGEPLRKHAVSGIMCYLRFPSSKMVSCFCMAYMTREVVRVDGVLSNADEK